MKEKFLYQPISPFSLAQKFGEDKLCVATDPNKVPKYLNKQTQETCPSGYKSPYANTNGHNGLDIRAYRWQPIYAAHDGIVTEVQTEIERGLGVGIVSNDKRFFGESNSKEHYKTRYWHFIALDVYRGEKIKVGDLIGYADSTGLSTGDHLHFELKPVKILDYENGVPVYNNVLQNNSHLGAIDPLPYMENITALQIAGIIRQIKELTAKIASFIADWLRK